MFGVRDIDVCQICQFHLEGSGRNIWETTAPQYAYGVMWGKEFREGNTAILYRKNARVKCRHFKIASTLEIKKMYKTSFQ